MSNEFFTFSLMVFTGFFAVMNPITNIPVFLGLVEGENQKSIISIAKKATIIAFIIVTAFILFGNFIFDLFNLTIPAFKMTGGVLMFYTGFEMLQSKRPSMHTHKNVQVDSGIAISPLAIPILAGPGTIVTAVNFTAGVDFAHILIIIAAFAIISFLTYLAFISSEKIVSILGDNIIDVLGKIMGLILTIIGMDMLTDGIKMTFGLT